MFGHNMMKLVTKTASNNAKKGNLVAIRPQSNMLKKLPQNAFGIFSKFLPIMLFILPIMLVLCFNTNNIDVRILLLECSIRVFMIRAYIKF